MSRLFGSIVQKENLDNNRTAQHHSNITECKAANGPGKESEKFHGLQQELQRCQDVLQWIAEDEERQVKSLCLTCDSVQKACGIPSCQHCNSVCQHDTVQILTAY